MTPQKAKHADGIAEVKAQGEARGKIHGANLNAGWFAQSAGEGTGQFEYR